MSFGSYAFLSSSGFTKSVNFDSQRMNAFVLGRGVGEGRWSGRGGLMAGSGAFLLSQPAPPFLVLQPGPLAGLATAST